MRKIFSLIGTALVVSTCLSAADPPLHRDWVGELLIGDMKHFVQLTIAADREPMSGTIAYPASDVGAISLSAISVERGHVKFAWTDDAGPMAFDGSLSAGLLEGTVRTGNKKGTLQLAPTVKLTAEAEQRLLGYYEMRPGHVVSILKFPLGPVYSDYTTGRVGVLFSSSEDAYFAGPSFQVPVPIAIRCRLSTDPKANLSALHWQDSSGQQIGRKLDQRREEVTFKDGDVVLSGTLVLPSGKGPHPALVRIQGAGPQTRRNAYDGWFAYHGVAYLSFDKRGTGKSTGDWREAGISELADDVLAAVRFLRQRNDIDPDQIGIEGDSEGGWIAPAVATRDPRIKFIVLWAGPAMDYVPELMNEVEENAKASGLGGDDLKKALEFKRQALRMLADGAGLSDDAWTKFQAFVGPYRNEKWFSYVSEPQKRGWPQEKLYLMAQIKSSELWRQVKVPVLALYGGKDLNVPAAKNVAALTQELTEAGNRDFTIKVFPDANHDGFETIDPMLDAEQMRYLERLVPGLVNTQITWVLAHVRIQAIVERAGWSAIVVIP
jgi:dienelactone hydrolase